MHCRMQLMRPQLNFSSSSSPAVQQVPSKETNPSPATRAAKPAAAFSGLRIGSSRPSNNVFVLPLLS